MSKKNVGTLIQEMMNRGGVGRYIEDFRTEFLSQSDIKQASEDLHIMMTPDKDMNVRRNAAKALAVVFPHVHDKTQAWNDIIRFVQEDEDWGIAGNLCTFLQYLPDKKQAWKDLIQLLMQHKRTLRKMNGFIKNHIDFRRQIAEKLDVAFIYVPDKILACEDLHELSIDKDYISRLSAAKSFGIAYSYFHDKKQADHDLHILTMDEVTDVRMYAADSLGVAFSSISDKMQSWDDIIRLIQEEKSMSIRFYSAKSLRTAFPHLPQKEKAWEYLHVLMYDKEKFLQFLAIETVSIVFPHIPNKEQAWDDLIQLISDEDIEIRVSANYSLGRISIYKATIAEDEATFRKEIEKAIEYFEGASKESISNDPANFCLPFYRSFYVITFKKQDTDIEIQKSIDEAKNAIKGSKSKKKLLEAVENLGNALKEAQKERDFNAVKSDLNSYRRYCERAAELLETTEDKAPSASKLIRKGLPIIDKSIKEILGEIQEKAKAACQQSIGSPAEELACTANREIQKWHIDDQEQMTWAVENLILSLSTKIPNIPENKRIFDKIEEIKNEGGMIKQYQSLAVLVALIPTTIVHKGDVYNVSGVTTSDNSQTIIKGNENTNNPVKASTFGFEPAKKTWIDVLNSSATVSAFAGFIVVEIGTYFYPLSYNHLISVIAAAISFTIVAMLNRR